ncbi:uncharacterized protein LOC143558676 [Bidens hawaiensis]|uniref:uncharacterized protein LOC143558676 n=1 Tax=Bidens hawaiensis TaxID=980011 RepID=UPI00404ADCB7
MAYGQHYRSPFGDTTLTKVFVGGLAWETPAGEMRKYFEQFGHILEAVIIIDKITGKSKGYGFVTYDDAESAKRACNDPNPVIDGRRANCNIASQGGYVMYKYLKCFQFNIGKSKGDVQSYPEPATPLAPPSVVYQPYGYATYPQEHGYNYGKLANASKNVCFSDYNCIYCNVQSGNAVSILWAHIHNHDLTILLWVFPHPSAYEGRINATSFVSVLSYAADGSI